METESVRPNAIPEQPRLGRPRLLPPAYERGLARMAGIATTRGAQVRYYAALAARILFDLEQPGWAPRDEAFAHFVKRNGDLMWSMLSELGRIPDEKALRALTRLVGRQRLPTGQAVALIRLLRIGDGSPHLDRRTTTD